jgi:hypothetical protein
LRSRNGSARWGCRTESSGCPFTDTVESSP